MKKIFTSVLLGLVLLVVPITALAGAKGPDVDNLTTRGWECISVGGEPHCFDPGDAKSRNGATVNVLVFDEEGQFEGTEILWLAGKAPEKISERPCPQDALLDLGFAYACHHYGH